MNTYTYKATAVVSGCVNECLQSEISISHKTVPSWIISLKATILAASVVGLLPSWPQPSDPHWGLLSLFSTRQLIHYRLRQAFWPVSNLWTCRAAVLAGEQHSVATGKNLTTQTVKYPSIWHTWAKGFLLIKSYLEEMTSTHPPASVNLFLLTWPLLCVEIKFLN